MKETTVAIMITPVFVFYYAIYQNSTINTASKDKTVHVSMYALPKDCGCYWRKIDTVKTVGVIFYHRELI